jgi:O-succinylhomoserine sulfhydrylase
MTDKNLPFITPPETFSTETYGTQTKMVRGGLARTAFQETAEPIFMNSGFTYQSAEEAEAAFAGEHARFVYARFKNPTVDTFEKRLAAIEGAAHCFATATGMAAVFGALACQLKAGDRVVASRALFGSCTHILNKILPNYGIKTELLDGTDHQAWAKALSTPATLVFLETPSNPTLEIIDLQYVADLAHQAGAKLVVDNAFSSPAVQNPLQYGADIITYSATKHIDGQGRCLGGAILTNDAAFAEDILSPFLRNTGPTMSPFNAWTLTKALETLDLRLQRHCENAFAVAQMLQDHPKIKSVRYPGLPTDPAYAIARKQMKRFGGMVAFEIEGGKAGAFRALNALQLLDISNNLGDSKTLLTHPATTTHQKLTAEEKAEQGITPGLVRMSVGLEDVQDICADLSNALARV